MKHHVLQGFALLIILVFGVCVIAAGTSGWVNTLSHCGVPGGLLGNLSKKEGILQNILRTRSDILNLFYVCVLCACMYMHHVHACASEVRRALDPVDLKAPMAVR